jgi:hypothetical protein
VVDIDHEPTKSSSFTHGVKDGETAVESPYDLIRRIFTYRIPVAYPIFEDAWHKDERRPEYLKYHVRGITAWLDSRVRGRPDRGLHRLPECRALLKAAGPNCGLLEAIHFRRVTGDDDGWPWEVQVRQLILAADGTKVPVALPKGTIKPRHHKVYSKPRRRLVVREVAKALHYPNWLIDPRVPVAQVVEYLNFRRDYRLIANYGRFRPSKT